MENSIILGLSLATLISAISYLIVLSQGNQKWKYILKPGTMALIILIAVVGLQPANAYGWLILIGLFFSVIGDVFLLFPNRFILGLIFFFGAHVFYIIGIACHFHVGFSGGVALSLGMIGLVYLLLLRRGVMREGGKPLVVAVLLYIGVICTMMYCAINSGQSVIMAAAALFFVSDAVLAWNCFIQKRIWGDHLVMATYYMAQYLFAISVSLL